jgi:hypothetical protein
MNIGNMPEEELDDLFRKSASEFHPEYDPAAWQAMEKKLDANRPHPGFWQRLSWLTALFLTMGLGFWISLLWLQYEEERAGLPFPTHTNSAHPGAQPKARDINRKPATPARKQTAMAAPQATPGEKAPQQDRLFRHNPGQGMDKALNPTYPRPVNRRRSMVPVLLPLAGDKAASGDKVASAPELLPPDNQANAVPAAGKEANTDPAKTGPAVIVQAVPLPAADSLAQAAGVPADSSGTPAIKALGTRSRLGLRLLLAPDLSTVGFAKPDGISTNVGIELSYQLRPRWRLATGVLKARKVYAAEAEDYGKHNFWDSRTLPDDIHAVCQVLDIPVNIGYQLFTGGKSAFTLNTGLSSYFMLSEDYHYYYHGSSYRKPYSRTWQVKNQNRHLFSIYNLSGLYSHRLTSAMAWGIEPFIKVPLAGVGAGRVKLASGGVAFSLSYQFR